MYYLYLSICAEDNVTKFRLVLMLDRLLIDFFPIASSVKKM